MKYLQSSGAKRMLVILMVLIIFVSTPMASLANTRILTGGQVPFYAQLSMDETVTDGTWVGIVFFRPPSCIPEDFNLLLYFDFATHLTASQQRWTVLTSGEIKRQTPRRCTRC